MSQDEIEKSLLQHLPRAPLQAMTLLSSIHAHPRRFKMAVAIASAWKQHDINDAWNSVAQSRLDPTDKQVIFNELWS